MTSVHSDCVQMQQSSGSQRMHAAVAMAGVWLVVPAASREMHAPSPATHVSVPGRPAEKLARHIEYRLDFDGILLLLHFHHGLMKLRRKMYSSSSALT
jgi:hypothetical protein